MTAKTVLRLWKWKESYRDKWTFCKIVCSSAWRLNYTKGNMRGNSSSRKTQARAE